MLTEEKAFEIRENVARIRENMKDYPHVHIMAVIKTRTPEEINFAVRECGITLLGENRVQELTAKYAQGAYDGAPVHFIGHLQTNKVKQVVGKVDLIQSVDSLRLARAIDKEAARQGIVQNVLLEINVGNEDSKSGFDVESMHEVLPEFSNFRNLHVCGLMAIPPICQNSADSRKFFQKIYALSVDITAKKYDNVSVRLLSMGMSGDFEHAIACGSNMIRVGTAIFGARNYNSSHQ